MFGQYNTSVCIWECMKERRSICVLLGMAACLEYLFFIWIGLWVCVCSYMCVFICAMVQRKVCVFVRVHAENDNSQFCACVFIWCVTFFDNYVCLVTIATHFKSRAFYSLVASGYHNTSFYTVTDTSIILTTKMECKGTLSATITAHLINTA